MTITTVYMSSILQLAAFVPDVAAGCSYFRLHPPEQCFKRAVRTQLPGSSIKAQNNRSA